MKIFVTVGAGFIGNHLVHSLLKDGNKVTIYDNLKNSSENKISHLLKNGASFVKADVTDYQTLSNAIAGIEGKKGNTYNIGSGKYTTIEDLAKLMISISGKPLSIEHKQSKKGDIQHSQTSIWLAQRDLGYSPKIQLKEGLEMLLKPIS